MYNPLKYVDPTGYWPVGDDVDIELILDEICKSGDCPDDMQYPDEIPDTSGYPRDPEPNQPNSPHPNIPGLDPSKWYWGTGKGGVGWRHPDQIYDTVWRWHNAGTAPSGTEGEEPHWDFFNDDCGGPGKWPFNPEWGRGTNEHMVRPYLDLDEGRYVSFGLDESIFSDVIPIIIIADDVIRSVPWEIVGPIFYSTFSGGGFQNEWGPIHSLE
jgi:hypothetical protein